MRSRFQVGQRVRSLVGVQNPGSAPPWELGRNDEQLAVIRHEGGPLCCLAAAGSGKTAALVNRVARLVGEVGVAPDRILCVTFSTKAANEMDARLRALGIGDCTVKTWHAFCRRVIREEPTREATWEVDDKDRAKVHVKKAIGYQHENWVGADLTKVRRYIGICKANLWAPDAPEARALAEQTFGVASASRAVRVYAISQDLIETAGLLTFDDMLCVVARLFERSEESRAAWAGKFDYVLTDEAQDNSRVQDVLAEALARDHRNLMVVGDLAQSLYSFRGARPELLAAFPGQWGAPVVAMHRNYRSGSAIIAVANEVIRQGVYRLPIDMAASREGAGEGAVSVVACGTLDDEAAEIVAAARAHQEGGGRLGEMLVLFRLNAQSRAVEDALLRARLPYVLVGGTNFYERKEVKDLLAYLRLAAGRDEADALRRCINAPFRFLGAKFVEKFGDERAHNPGADLGDVLRATMRREGIQRRQIESASEWLSVVERVRAMVRGERQPGTAEVPERAATANEVLEHVVRATRYVEWLEKEEGEESIESSHAANVREMLRVAQSFPTVAELLDYVDKQVGDSARQRRDKRGDAITLMSCHRAKGLEWPFVWLVGCNEGVLPHAKGDPEEERRIMYVAVTRARDRLVVSYVREMATRAGLRQVSASRFLRHFPEPRALREEAPPESGPRESVAEGERNPGSAVDAEANGEAGPRPNLSWLGSGAICAACGRAVGQCEC